MRKNILRILKKIILYFIHKFLIVFITLMIPFILILKKRKDFYFALLPVYRMGVYLALEPFILENENNFSKRNITIFCYLQKQCTNKFLADLYINKIKASKNIKIINGSRFKNLLWRCFLDIDKILFKKKSKFFLQLADRAKYNIFVHGKSLISMAQRDNEKALESLSYLGLNKKSKWVCIHNRDSAYLNWLTPKKNWKYHDYRNWAIDDLQLASEYFVKKGYFVFRIGKKTDQKMKTNNPKIIDFINHKERNDLNEIFLISNCKFYFGSNCGINAVPIIFRKPVFIINHCPIEGIFAYARKYPCIFKRAYDTERKKILSIREMVKKDLLRTFKTEEYNKKKIKLLNNTPSEILSFAIEAEKRVNSTWISDRDYLNNSSKFSEEVLKDPLVKNMYYKNNVGQEFLRNTIIC